MNPELLEKIQKVDAPAGLMAIIEQKIGLEQQKKAAKLVWRYALACSIVFIIDFSVIAAQKTHFAKDNNLSESFQINPDNQLYRFSHE